VSEANGPVWKAKRSHTRTLTLALVLVGALAHDAAAHQSSVKYVDVAIDGDALAIELRLAPGDVTEPMHLPPDAKPTVSDAARSSAVAPYIARWVDVRTATETCTTSSATTRPDEDGKLLVVAWQVECTTPPRRLDFTPFFVIDRRHEAIVHVELARGGSVDRIVRVGEPSVELEVARDSIAMLWRGLTAPWSPLHLTFLGALVATLVLRRDGDDPRWRLRPWLEVGRAAGRVVGVFVLGQLLGFVAFACEWVAIAPGVLAAALATSTVYVALDTLASPTTRSRFALAAGFGVVHGLGFADYLLATSGSAGDLASVASLQLGVAVGTVFVAAVAVTTCNALAYRIGAVPYRRVAMPVLAAIMISVAIASVFA
jgi:hypothetical protein